MFLLELIKFDKYFRLSDIVVNLYNIVFIFDLEAIVIVERKVVWVFKFIIVCG